MRYVLGISLAMVIVLLIVAYLPPYFAVVGRLPAWDADRVADAGCGDDGRIRRRPEMDADLIGPDVDALDQGGEDGTPACSRQLGPALPELGGARDEPALRR